MGPWLTMLFWLTLLKLKLLDRPYWPCRSVLQAGCTHSLTLVVMRACHSFLFVEATFDLCCQQTGSIFCELISLQNIWLQSSIVFIKHILDGDERDLSVVCQILQMEIVVHTLPIHWCNATEVKSCVGISFSPVFPCLIGCI